MTLGDLVARLQWRNFTPSLGPSLSARVERAMACDVLSDALARAPSAGIWITTQCHLNVVAVATRRHVTGVLLTCGLCPDRTMIEGAEREGVVLVGTARGTFDVAGTLYALGVRGERE